MLSNHFTHSPTVGSHDQAATVEELQARIRYLEQQLLIQQQAQANAEKPKGWFKLGKIRKFFTSIIIPILAFIPRFINAVANYNNTTRNTVHAH